MEIKPILDDETGEEIQGYKLKIGSLELFFPTKKEAEEFLAWLKLRENKELADFMTNYHWEESILKALKKQNQLFVMMLQSLFCSAVYWEGGIAADMVLQAADFCQSLQSLISPPAPAWHSALKSSEPGMC